MTYEARRGLADRLRAAIDADDAPALNAALRGAHPADIAEAINDGGFSDEEARRVFAALDDARAAEVLDETDPGITAALLDGEEPGRAAELLTRLPADDAAEVVAEVAGVAPGRADALLADLSARDPDDAAEVRERLSHAEGTAGRLMADGFLRFSEWQTVEQALAALRAVPPEGAHAAALTDLYVVAPAEDGSGRERLLGLVNLRHLVRAEPRRRLGEVMVRNPLTVSVDAEQREAVRLIAKYDFLAVPVLDRDGFLVGVVTVDDALDVLTEERDEEYFRAVGSDAAEMERRTPAQIARLRLPWLLGTMLIELGAGLVIHRYEWVLKEVLLLASFMPVISAISGNTGLQAAAIIVRGLETGHVSVNGLGRAIRREASTALLLAVSCGLVLGTVGALWSRHLPFGLVVGGAMTCSMLTASVMGTVAPIVSKRLGFDPATTAGPFETAFQDVIGYGVFLWLASRLLPWLT